MKPQIRHKLLWVLHTKLGRQILVYFILHFTKSLCETPLLSVFNSRFLPCLDRQIGVYGCWIWEANSKVISVKLWINRVCFASLTDRTSNGSVWLVCLWSFTALKSEEARFRVGFCGIVWILHFSCFDFCSIRSLCWFSFPFLIDGVDSVRSTACQRKF